ncbi:MAG: hypothetical protein EZS28_017530 [Streblomastix strix]|uniref:Uncharacterized protein n=1 Tax=Streblomastix strix TaxID=222440 RepID=A0A5J4VX82_9EUKA|nr:MAG: hypothetical protein EZS28_017527 [Streblomastix strix]KAA6386946.1 MAG: hypothetical protein EZS28_017530 [Streblomastix strix]
MQAIEQPQLTFVKAFRWNIQMGPLDPEQMIASPEDLLSNAIIAALALLAGLSGQKASQIEFYSEASSEEWVVEARQRVRSIMDLKKRGGPPKLNNVPAQLKLAFDHELANLDTKLLQQYKLLQGTLTVVVKRDWISTLKFNLHMFLCIKDKIYMENMILALMVRIEQEYLLMTQPSPVIIPGYYNWMLRSMGEQFQTEEAHLVSVDTLLTRIVGITGKLDQELKKLTAQQVIDMIRSKPEIMLPEWAQDLARKSTIETQLTALLPLLSQLQQYSLNPYALLNPFQNQIPQQQTQGQQPPQYSFQCSGQQMQYLIYLIQFPVIPLLNPILPTVNPQQTTSNSRLPSNKNVGDQQNPIQPFQQVDQAVI